ncbi:MAG: stage II sporulation protein R [Oscillospiraceae bacterium]|nr:stage II sporulation protein R [Oscillospiraceae bacterium]
MKKYAPLIFLTLLFLSLWTAAMDEAAAAPLRGKVLRLRVVAASDSPEDQARKLLVRDEALALLTPLLEDCSDLSEARAAVEESLPELCRRAEALLRSGDAPAPVRGRLGEEDCPLRDYGSFALPAGRYETLTLTVGPGEGHNWWCVVFPPLCLAAAEEEGEDSLAVFSPGEVKLLRGEGRVLRLRCLELWQKLRAWLGRN